MKQKVKKLSIRWKILIPATVLIIITCVVLGITGYRSLKSGMIEMGVEEANMAVQIATDSVDGDELVKLGPGCEESAIYKSILDQLRKLQKKYTIAYIFTLYTDGEKVYYGVDSDDTDGQSAFGDEFEEDASMVMPVFAGQVVSEDYISRTEFGDLITVYAPITDSDGNVVGAIGCDYDASNVIKRLNSSTMYILVISGVSLFVALLLMNIIVGRIARTLGKVNLKIYDLVHNEGDLTQHLDIKTGDELELIAENVNKLLEHIREIMLSISDESVQLNSSASSVVNSLSSAEMSISDVSATMEEMSAAMEETSASLNQMNESIYAVTMTVDGMAGNADMGKMTSDEISEKASAIYEKARKEQEEAKKHAQALVTVVNDKIEKSRSVEKIAALTDNIINITSQTNLLSLNASIEAARAGEAGRGFAVVADEIGKLAINSAESAAQIQEVSTQVIDAVNELAKKSEEMLEFVEKTAMAGYDKLLETSGSYRDDVSEMGMIMETFATESADVKETITSIKEAMDALDIAVEESAKGITNVTEHAVNLTSMVVDIGNEAGSNKDVADQLSIEVNKFKLH